MQRFSSGVIPVVAVLTACLATACGNQKPNAAGHVSLVDEPLKTGSILFVPVAGTAGGPAGAAINEGRFTIVNGLVPGEYRVEIRQARPSETLVPKPFGAPGEMVRATEEGVAKRFNELSELRVTVASGSNTFDFRVTAR